MKVIIRQPFTLNLGIVDGIPKLVEYKEGTHEMPPDHFEHWWAQRHNVESLEPKASAQPVAQLPKTGVTQLVHSDIRKK